MAPPRAELGEAPIARAIGGFRPDTGVVIGQTSAAFRLDVPSHLRML